MPYTVAFFGATGGCANACLTYLLLSNKIDAGVEHRAVALARNPQKLIDSLKKQPGITDSILAEKLRIVKGDATEVADVKQTLLCQGKKSIDNNNNNSESESSSEPTLVDSIVSGIGSYPVRQKGTLIGITMENPQITEQYTTALTTALREIYAEQWQIKHKPVITAISTTGLPRPEGAKEDVPFGMRTFYHVVLAAAHKDKFKMEEILSSAAPAPATQGKKKNEEEEAALFQGLVITRPTLLAGDGTLELKKQRPVRAGTEFAPAMGYLILRADVGKWIWENVLLNEDRGEKWYGKKVSLAY